MFVYITIFSRSFLIAPLVVLLNLVDSLSVSPSWWTIVGSCVHVLHITDHVMVMDTPSLWRWRQSAPVYSDQVSQMRSPRWQLKQKSATKAYARARHVVVGIVMIHHYRFIRVLFRCHVLANSLRAKHGDSSYRKKMKNVGSITPGERTAGAQQNIDFMRLARAFGSNWYLSQTTTGSR